MTHFYRRPAGPSRPSLEPALSASSSAYGSTAAEMPPLEHGSLRRASKQRPAEAKEKPPAKTGRKEGKPPAKAQRKKPFQRPKLPPLFALPDADTHGRRPLCAGFRTCCTYCLFRSEGHTPSNHRFFEVASLPNSQRLGLIQNNKSVTALRACIRAMCTHGVRHRLGQMSRIHQYFLVRSMWEALFV